MKSKVNVEFLIASNFRPVAGYVDLRNKRGAVDKMATAITKARNLKGYTGKETELKFQVGKYFLSKPAVVKVLLAKVDTYTVKNWEYVAREKTDDR